jgi:hypothetical protein
MRSVEAEVEEDERANAYSAYSYADYDDYDDYYEPFEFFLDQDDLQRLENSDLVSSPSRLQRVVDRWGCTLQTGINLLQQ